MATTTAQTGQFTDWINLHSPTTGEPVPMMPQICTSRPLSANEMCMQSVTVCTTDQATPFPLSRDGEILKFLNSFGHSQEVRGRDAGLQMPM